MRVEASARLETFSDGVFAIAATLLILEIRVDDGAADLPAALLDLWPSYAAYAISFLTIGIMWVNHHALFRQIDRVDRTFLMLNAPCSPRGSHSPSTRPWRRSTSSRARSSAATRCPAGPVRDRTYGSGNPPRPSTQSAR